MLEIKNIGCSTLFRGRAIYSPIWVYGSLINPDIAFRSNRAYILDPINFLSIIRASDAKEIKANKLESNYVLPKSAFIQVTGLSVGQHSGCYDMNEVPIFEGDRVQASDGQMYDVYRDGNSFKLAHIDACWPPYIELQDDFRPHTLKVVGKTLDILNPVDEKTYQDLILSLFGENEEVMSSINDKKMTWKESFEFLEKRIYTEFPKEKLILVTTTA